MPEAVLAGPDGKPAIDQLTGMPLTMEELIRRRGYIGVAGVRPAANPAETALAVSADATAANSDGSAAAIGASPDTLNAVGVPQGSTPATPTVRDALTADPTGAPGDGASSDDWLKWLLGGAAIAGTGYAAKKLLGRGPGGVAVEEAIPADAAVIDGVARPVGPSVNDTLTRVDNGGSNVTLDALIDSKNVTRAGQIGAGPKALQGPLPVEDLNDTSLVGAVKDRTRSLTNEYDGPSSGPRTRMQQGAARANIAREGSVNDNAIALRDRFTDLSDDEYKLATVLAGRLQADRDLGVGKLPNRIGSTRVRSNNLRANRTLNNPITPPAVSAQENLIESLKLVRKLKQSGGLNAAGGITRALRAVRP